MRAKLVKESFGSGFSMTGGMTGGMSGRGGGFGGSSNLSGPNMMYTYEIKPLNTLLTQKQPKTNDFEDIHIGKSIRGTKINDNSKRKYSGHVIGISKSANGSLKYYEIIDKTGTKVKINPTTAILLHNAPEMEDLALRDVYGDEKSELKSGMRESLVPENLDELFENKKEA